MPQVRDGTNLDDVDPSKPTEGELNKSTSIPRSRQGSEEALVGEIIDKGIPLSRPVVDAEPKNPPRKVGKIRTAFIVMLSVSALICLGGLVVGFVWYRSASEPDRGTPTVTLEQYLDAEFNTRDEMIVKRFECNSPSLSTLDQLLDDLIRRENQYGVSITVHSANLDVVQNHGSSVIKADLKISTSNEREIQRWQFNLIDQAGWRVCAASRID